MCARFGHCHAQIRFRVTECPTARRLEFARHSENKKLAQLSVVQKPSMNTRRYSHRTSRIRRSQSSSTIAANYGVLELVLVETELVDFIVVVVGAPTSVVTVVVGAPTSVVTVGKVV